MTTKHSVSCPICFDGVTSVDHILTFTKSMSYSILFFQWGEVHDTSMNKFLNYSKNMKNIKS